jgi:hypothetical protein
LPQRSAFARKLANRPESVVTSPPSTVKRLSFGDPGSSTPIFQFALLSSNAM